MIKKIFKVFSKLNKIDYEEVDKFIAKTLIRHRLIGLAGFLIGLKISGYLFFDSLKYDIIREDLEMDYWKEYGIPKHLSFDIIPCVSPKRINEECKTYIKIKYLKDQYLRKIDPSELN